jgi:DNA processing protein
MIDINIWHKIAYLPENKLKMLREIYLNTKNPYEFYSNDNVKKLINKIKISENYQEILEDKNINFIDIYNEFYPSKLKNITTHPLCLYYKTYGALDILKKPIIAIIGSRTPSLANINLVEKLSKYLSEHNFVIISGLARGIDTIAHEHAEKTIAVLGSSIDIIYPAENKYLAEEICKKGLLISEYPLGTNPRKQNFPMRNRIIAALADIVIIIEAKINSGSMITAKYGLTYNKEIFAVPGHPLDYKVAGCNQLIKDGAYLLDDFREVIEVFNREYSHLAIKQINHEKINKEEQSKVEISELEKKILSLLSEQSITDEELMIKMNIEAAELKKILTKLEIDDYIYKDIFGKISRHFTNK